MAIVRAITMAAMLLACGKQRQKQWQQQQASGWSEERSSMTMERSRRAENIESCRLQFMVSFSVKSVFRRPQTAKIFRPAGAVSRGLWGGRWAPAQNRLPWPSPSSPSVYISKSPPRALLWCLASCLRWALSWCRRPCAFDGRSRGAALTHPPSFACL